MGAHHRRTDPGAGAERPAFDEVTHGYDPRQVDDYLATLWRYASQVTSRAAAAESALKAERERSASAGADEQLAAQAGGRIGQMLAIAHQEAEEIINGARVIAESALEEAIEDAGANHPIVREARDQAERLLLDAVEESRRIAAERHLELREEITRSAASLDALRHQQGEIIGAVLRLRAILGSDEVDRAVTDLARAGAAPSAGGDVPGGDVPGRGVPGGGVPGGELVDLTFPRLRPFGQVTQRDLDVEQILHPAQQGERRLRARGVRHVVRHRRPERHRRELRPRTRLAEHADDPRRSLVA
ncbi:hypothetical protein FRACA_2460005 [Frankia canadensis]|uniref:Uncharacterized protein n=1 Tax=Frankia canadensis TaxID=1836972 RepID=A0A2I2KRX1_9ACTN|nr:hypothetical protein FRACA_2460005 [Frankia canadensis]SOU55692.1 hypothetical protein FRACA_2460005 [Frankia canadensis]